VHAPIAVAGGLPTSVTSGALTMTGLLGSAPSALPDSVTSGALSMTGLLGGPVIRLPDSVTSPPLEMTGIFQPNVPTNVRRTP
jgi:hypothetical protein